MSLKSCVLGGYARRPLYLTSLSRTPNNYRFWCVCFELLFCAEVWSTLQLKDYNIFKPHMMLLIDLNGWMLLWASHHLHPNRDNHPCELIELGTKESRQFRGRKNHRWHRESPKLPHYLFILKIRVFIAAILRNSRILSCFKNFFSSFQKVSNVWLQKWSVVGVSKDWSNKFKRLLSS